ncbi:putative non-structural transmembrane glycoprotein [Hapavirus ngaingan]|uniref:Putative non-structural transmembrane glycoprotein n=1 Tax=Hapavirus ngaingan TaxID=1972623 RepID=D3GGL8_9RHAB|nr:putative non-structural transmembrane glycoprotein [Hapavirus ngaingan]ACX83609.1 putative non-structural transmembrane glycoprotein [Hapavirus ngaingan]
MFYLIVILLSLVPNSKPEDHQDAPECTHVIHPYDLDDEWTEITQEELNCTQEGFKSIYSGPSETVRLLYPPSSLPIRKHGYYCRKIIFRIQCVGTWYFTSTVTRSVVYKKPTLSECKEGIAMIKVGNPENFHYPAIDCRWAQTTKKEKNFLQLHSHSVNYDIQSGEYNDDLIIASNCTSTYCPTKDTDALWVSDNLYDSNDFCNKKNWISKDVTIPIAGKNKTLILHLAMTEPGQFWRLDRSCITTLCGLNGLLTEAGDFVYSSDYLIQNLTYPQLYSCTNITVNFLTYQLRGRHDPAIETTMSYPIWVDQCLTVKQSLLLKTPVSPMGVNILLNQVPGNGYTYRASISGVIGADSNKYPMRGILSRKSCKYTWACINETEGEILGEMDYEPIGVDIDGTPVYINQSELESPDIENKQFKCTKCGKGRKETKTYKVRSGLKHYVFDQYIAKNDTYWTHSSTLSNTKVKRSVNQTSIIEVLSEEVNTSTDTHVLVHSVHEVPEYHGHPYLEWADRIIVTTFCVSVSLLVIITLIKLQTARWIKDVIHYLRMKEKLYKLKPEVYSVEANP